MKIDDKMMKLAYGVKSIVIIKETIWDINCKWIFSNNNE